DLILRAERLECGVHDTLTDKFTIEVTEDLNGDCFIELPEEILNEFNLKEGDTLSWEHIDDKSGYKLKKKQG
ncbi:hypothetical protein AB6C85_19010, partial [Vibrio splendidus]